MYRFVGLFSKFVAWQWSLGYLSVLFKPAKIFWNWNIFQFNSVHPQLFRRFKSKTVTSLQNKQNTPKNSPELHQWSRRGNSLHPECRFCRSHQRLQRWSPHIRMTPRPSTHTSLDKNCKPVGQNNFNLNAFINTTRCDAFPPSFWWLALYVDRSQRCRVLLIDTALTSEAWKNCPNSATRRLHWSCWAS